MRRNRPRRQVPRKGSGTNTTTGGDTNTTTVEDTTSTTTAAVSQQRLAQLDGIQHRADAIASEYEELAQGLLPTSAEAAEGPEALTTRKNQLILLYTNLEKLQFHEIDGVLVGDLTSGQEAARARGQELTQAVSDLAGKFKATTVATRRH